MYKKVFKFLPILIIILGLFIIIAPLTFAGPCKGLLELKSGMAVPMKCVWSARVIIIFGILFCINGTMLLFTKGWSPYRFYGIQIITLSIAFLLIPTTSVIGICSHEMAACHYMASVERLIGMLLLITGLILVFTPNNRHFIDID